MATKRENFERIATIVANDEELSAFIAHEIEQLDKRKSYKSSKPSKNQVANEGIKSQIYTFIEGNPHIRTKDIADAVGISSQKASALIKQMKEAGTIIRTEEKGVAYFTVA